MLALDPLAVTQALVRIDTVNPPENEDTSIALLADLLSQAGFACRTSEFAPRRTSLVARIGYLRADFAWSCCPETVVNEPRRLFFSALAELD